MRKGLPRGGNSIQQYGKIWDMFGKWKVIHYGSNTNDGKEPLEGTASLCDSVEFFSVHSLRKTITSDKIKS